MPLPSNSSAPERRATMATIDAGTAVAPGVVLATTVGTGSLDRCACELAARLDVRAVEIDGYLRTGDLFGVPLLSRRSLQFLVADLDHVRLLRRASGRLVHFPHHHLARAAPGRVSASPTMPMNASTCAAWRQPTSTIPRNNVTLLIRLLSRVESEKLRAIRSDRPQSGSRPHGPAQSPRTRAAH